MPRVKTGVVRHHKHRKTLKLTKGFRGANRRLIKRATEASLHAGQYAFVGRKLRKRDMRTLWILRISAGLKQLDESLNYSRFINNLKKANIALNRKMLAELAINDPTAFKAIADKAGQEQQVKAGVA
jgi:large subunit ribosomal protein L20